MKRSLWLTLAGVALLVTGCENSRLVGVWKGTNKDGAEVIYQYRGNGELIVTKGGNTENGDWKSVSEDANVVKFESSLLGKGTANIRDSNHCSISVSNESIELTRIAGGGVEGASPDKSYVFPFAFVVLVLALGLSVVGRSSRRKSHA